MNLDIKTFIATALASLEQSLGEDWNSVKELATTFFTQKEERLQELADLRLAGEIDDDFLLERVKDEGDILKSESVALGIAGAANAENILNSIASLLVSTLANLL